MRFAATLLLGLALVATLPQIVSAEPDDAHPSWRVQVRAYGPEGSSVVGLHHRAGKSAEIGLSFDGSIRNWDADKGLGLDDDAESRSSTFHLRPEYRRRSAKTGALSTFWAANILLGYELRETHSAQSSWVRDTKSESVWLGTGLSLGVDVALLEHLSATMIVTPIDIRHEWTDYEEDTKPEESGPTDKRHETQMQAAFTLTPALYATFRF